MTTDDLPYEPVDRDRQAERARAEKLPGYTEARKMTPEIADMLNARERLMEDIDSIVHNGFIAMFGWEDVDGWDEQRSEMIKVLCDAVCKNFPLLMEPE